MTKKNGYYNGYYGTTMVVPYLGNHSPSSDFTDFGDVCVGFAAFLRRVFKCVPQDAIVVKVGVGGHYGATAEARVRECPTDEINAGVGRRAVSSGRG
jgi:hypothetical protein